MIIDIIEIVGNVENVDKMVSDYRKEFYYIYFFYCNFLLDNLLCCL